MNNILAIRIDMLGDLIITLPALKAIKDSYPNCRMTLLCKKEFKELVKNEPYLDQVITADKSFFPLLALVRQNRFDAVFDCMYSNQMLPGILTFLSGARQRFGFATPRKRLFYTKTVVPKEPLQYEMGYLQDLLAVAGINFTPGYVAPELLSKSEAKVEEFVKKNRLEEGLIVGIQPCVSKVAPAKAWAEQNFIELSIRLIENYNARIIFTGTKDECKRIERIKELIPYETYVAAGEFTLPELEYFLSRIDLFVTNNTGPMHLALSLGAPTVTISGPSSKVRWVPPFTVNGIFVTHDLLCSRNDCGGIVCKIPEKDFRCIRGITVDEVYNACRRLLGDVQSVVLP